MGVFVANPIIIRSLIQQCNVPLDQLKTHFNLVKDYTLRDRQWNCLLLKVGIPFETLAAFDPEKLEMFVNYAFAIERMVCQRHVPLRTLVNMDAELQEKLILMADRIHAAQFSRYRTELADESKFSLPTELERYFKREQYANLTLEQKRMISFELKQIMKLPEALSGIRDRMIVALLTEKHLYRIATVLTNIRSRNCVGFGRDVTGLILPMVQQATRRNI